VLFLVRSVQVGHSFAALIQEDESSAKAIVRQSTDMLIHSSLSPGQEPQYALDNEIGHKPTHSARSDSIVNIRRFKEVGDETVDGKPALELLAEDLEAGQGFGEGQEASSETHCDRSGIGLDSFVSNIW
jgi:hypothetical protein